MATPPRLVPLLAQYDLARTRLHDRMAGPGFDSGTGTRLEVTRMTDEEHLWEPVPACWSVRRRSEGPGPHATELFGSGEWGLDFAPGVSPPPFTTIAWRLGHLSALLAVRADHTVGSHTLTRDAYHFSGDVTAALEAFDVAAEACREGEGQPG